MYRNSEACGQCGCWLGFFGNGWPKYCGACGLAVPGMLPFVENVSISSPELEGTEADEEEEEEIEEARVRQAGRVG